MYIAVFCIKKYIKYSENINNCLLILQEPDETLSERLWGLTEMFPVCVRNGTYTITTKTW